MQLIFELYLQKAQHTVVTFPCHYIAKCSYFSKSFSSSKHTGDTGSVSALRLSSGDSSFWKNIVGDSSEIEYRGLEGEDKGESGGLILRSNIARVLTEFKMLRNLTNCLIRLWSCCFRNLISFKTHLMAWSKSLLRSWKLFIFLLSSSKQNESLWSMFDCFSNSSPITDRGVVKTSSLEDILRSWCSVGLGL